MSSPQFLKTVLTVTFYSLGELRNYRNFFFVMKKYMIFFSFLLQALYCLAQVPVSKEPRHHNVFENSFVRVLDVHVPPGDTTLYHKHETPSVFVMLNPVKTGSQVIMEERAATALAKDASISFEGFYTTPRIHRVWNEGNSEFHVMDIEILQKGKQNIDSPIQENGLRLLFDEPVVRGYRLNLETGKVISIKKETAFLIIGLSDALNNVQVNQKQFSKKGNYLFIDANQTITISNNSNQVHSFAVLEIK
jgi:hypothetical protein